MAIILHRMDKERPNIFLFLNYREFIKDYCKHEKTINRLFSLRTFSGKISPTLFTSGLLYAILKGKRNMSSTLRPKFVRAMALKEREAQYFEFLVQFNQAKDMEEKNHYFLQLSQFRGSKAKILSESQYKFFSNWYYPVIWNYFELNQTQTNPVEIAKRIHPTVTSNQVEEAIQLLMSLKLIKKMANGYAVTDKHIATEPEFRGFLAKHYNLQFIQMAANMLDSVAPEYRQYNTLVFSTSERGFEAIKERIVSFQEELKEIIDRERETDRICTLSMQLYPNTKMP
ncbi:MAG: hypothetical protein JWO30_605 [Fibrobacteres bacterium]|nr:hypothetical protein [Fibrobacterota bacterium]